MLLGENLSRMLNVDCWTFFEENLYAGGFGWRFGEKKAFVVVIVFMARHFVRGLSEAKKVFLL